MLAPSPGLRCSYLTLFGHRVLVLGFVRRFRSGARSADALCRRARSTLAVQSPQSANAAEILCAFSRAVCGLLLSIIAGDHVAMRSPLGVCVGWVLISLDFPHVALVWAGCHTQLTPSPIPFGLTWCHHQPMILLNQLCELHVVGPGHSGVP